MDKVDKRLKALRLFSLLSLLSFGVAIAIWVCMALKVIEFSGVMVVVAGVLTTFSLTLSLCAPWFKKLVQGQYRVVSIVFLALSAAVFALLVSDIVSLYLMVEKIASSAEFVFAEYVSMLNFLKYTLLVVVQIVLATIISNYVLRFKFKFIILQTVSYASLLYMDFVLCVVALSISIADSGLVFGNPTGLLTNFVFWAGLAIAIVVKGWMYKLLKKVDKFFGTNTTKEIMKDEKQPENKPVENTEN